MQHAACADACHAHDKGRTYVRTPDWLEREENTHVRSETRARPAPPTQVAVQFVNTCSTLVAGAQAARHGPFDAAMAKRSWTGAGGGGGGGGAGAQMMCYIGYYASTTSSDFLV
jgi:hypothetical protein